MQRRCARQLENCSISTPLPLSKTNLTGRWVVVVVVSRSTFDTTRFQESSKELQVLIKLWKPAVFHTRAPLFLSFLFPTNSSLSLSLPFSSLFFSFVLLSSEITYFHEGYRDRSPRRKTDFHTFPLCKFLLKKKPPPGVSTVVKKGVAPLWIQIVAGSRRSPAWEEDISITPRAQDEFLPQG